MNAKRLVPLFAKIPVYSKFYSNITRNLQKLELSQFNQNKCYSRASSATTAPSEKLAKIKIEPLPLSTPSTTTLVDNVSQSTTSTGVQPHPEPEPKVSAFTEEAAISDLLKCGKLSHQKSVDLRREQQQNVWAETLNYKDRMGIDVYNTYVQICIDNELPIDYKTFLQLAHPVTPNQQTYLSLLQLASLLGDVNEAVEILTEMKAQGMTADEHVFNALIVGYTLHKGLEGANYVLGTMKLAHVPITARTNWGILNGLVRHGKRAEFRQFLEIIPSLSQTDREYVDLLHLLGAHGQHAWLGDVLPDFDWDAKDRAFMNAVQEVCIALVHSNQPEAAITFYNTFVDVTPEQSYGKSLLAEMLTCQLPIDTIIEGAKKLQEKNTHALFDLAVLTLNKQCVEHAYQVFGQLSFLRPHFFWPLLQVEGRANGELGVLNVLKRMDELNVKPDYATLEEYALRYFNLREPRAILEALALQVPNLMYRDILSPLLAVLLRANLVDEAKNLCASSSKTPVLADPLIRHLADAWTRTKNTALVGILQKLCETNTPSVDYTGIFVERCLRKTKQDDAHHVLALLKTLDEHKLRLTATYYDALTHMLAGTADCEAQLERLLDITKQEGARITHPRDMNVDELECHLVELEAKGMDVRGVVRKLLMAHARRGHHERVTQLRKYMLARNYDESAGMKSTLFHSFVMSGDLKSAKSVYEELKTTYPSFKVDSFKMVDFATLLVKSDAIDEAISTLNRETRPIKVDSSMERNCWNLLGAAKRPEDAFRLFELMVAKNYCKPTNVILGPILRPFVSTDTIDKLVNNFVNCCEQYKATPLQLEVLCVVLDAKNEALLQRVIDAITRVHGGAAARLGLISALAEKGLEKPILKLLAERQQFKITDLSNRIQRWVNEEKLLPLETLEAANRRLSISAFDTQLTSSAIMKIHCNRHDFPSALNYWRHLEENDGAISQPCAAELVALLEKHMFTVPDSLRHLSTKSESKKN